jgi:SAM-dependent methyltransferase
MEHDQLTSLDSHFAFGANWASFSKLVDASRVAAAERALKVLTGDLNGKSFLDIGCGSGLSTLAAVHLSARRAVGTDIDPQSTATAAALLGPTADVRTVSVFDMTPVEQFDVVHSWGVLHHTGDMWRAIDKAAQFVKPDGLLVIALYLKTPLCGLWRAEKRLYSRSPAIVQRIIRSMFAAALYIRAPGRTNWLGGYPYESATPQEVIAFLTERSFSFERGTGFEAGLGLFGTGCAEYVFRRDSGH